MINVKNIYKNFGNVEVLKGVSCEIKHGEKVVIIGPSGSGKSTLLRCMNLLETPTYGEIWLEDKLLTPIDPYLHFDVIRLSKTYRSMLEERKLSNPESSEAELDKEIIAKIKAEDLLQKNEGKEFKQEI
ncbi:MAG: ATP-binding cassette domain-containing protein, partial [Clostridia bacterium]|nr:ATP-binding cassette domain-containing protein [Clostridia bacterium]